MDTQTKIDIPKAPKKGWLHYGYVIVAAGFFTQVILLSSQRSLSIALVNIQETLQVSYAQVGLISSYFGLVYAGAAFLWGWLADHAKIGPRLAITGAGACASIGLLLFGLVGGQSLNLAIATYTLVGLGCAGIYIATIPKLVSAWFVPEKRGHAMRFITPGGGITSMILGVVLPIGMVARGWQSCFIVLGIIAGVITLGFFTLLRDDPAQKGLTPVGSPPGTPVVAVPKKIKKDNNFRAVLKMPITWHIGIMYIIYQLGYMANSTYYVAGIKTAGYSSAQAGLAVTIAAIVSILFMQLWGPLSDRLERKTVIAIGSFGYAFFAILYYFALISGPSLIVCYILVSFMQGCFGITPVIMAALADYYPADLRGTGNGVISTMSMVGRYGGPFLAGLCIDAAGGQVAYGFIFAAVVVSISAVITLTWPKLKAGSTQKAGATN